MPNSAGVHPLVRPPGDVFERHSAVGSFDAEPAALEFDILLGGFKHKAGETFAFGNRDVCGHQAERPVLMLRWENVPRPNRTLSVSP